MKYRFQDNTLPFEERAKDLLSRLTREEKVGMITSQLDAIPRLGIQKTHIGTEIARGVVNRDQKRETTHVLVAEYQPVPRPALGQKRRSLWRRPVPYG